VPLSFETRQEIESALGRYPERRTAVLDSLRAAQRERGYLSSDTIREVAEILDMDPSALVSLVTFYDLFHDNPVGEHVIMVCRSISCYLRGADDLIQYISERLGVPVGGTTADGKFTLKTIECLASCGTAPAMLVNERYYEQLTRERVDQILSALASSTSGKATATGGAQ
jgi:NADH-quinone oxidoreductase subunit E